MIRRLTRDRYLSDDELDRFLAVARTRRHVHQPRDYALFVLIVNTGIRPSEAMRLCRRDLSLSGKHPWIRLHRPELSHGPRLVNELEIRRDVADVLLAHCGAMEPDAKLWPMTKRQSERLFRYYAAKAGLPESHHLFTLRHTAGMRMYRGCRDVRIIQAIMGHRWLKAANAYVHVGSERVRDALESVTV